MSGASWQLAGEALIGGGFQRYPLRTHGHRNAQLLGGLGQMRIDRRRARRATGHGADQQGRAQAPSEQRRLQVDLVQCNSGRGAVLKAEGAETGPVAAMARVGPRTMSR